MFAHKLKICLLPQLIVTMHVHCLHWLMSSAFCQPCKSTTGEMAPKEASNLAAGDLTWFPLSVHICLVEYWPFVGAFICHSYSKLYYLCLLASLFKLLSPTLHPSHPPPYIHWPNINEFHEKIIKNW